LVPAHVLNELRTTWNDTLIHHRPLAGYTPSARNVVPRNTRYTFDKHLTFPNSWSTNLTNYHSHNLVFINRLLSTIESTRRPLNRESDATFSAPVLLCVQYPGSRAGNPGIRVVDYLHSLLQYQQIPWMVRAAIREQKNEDILRGASRRGRGF